MIFRQRWYIANIKSRRVSHLHYNTRREAERFCRNHPAYCPVPGWQILSRPDVWAIGIDTKSER